MYSCCLFFFCYRFWESQTILWLVIHLGLVSRVDLADASYLDCNLKMCTCGVLANYIVLADTRTICQTCPYHILQLIARQYFVNSSTKRISGEFLDNCKEFIENSWEFFGCSKNILVKQYRSLFYNVDRIAIEFKTESNNRVIYKTDVRIESESDVVNSSLVWSQTYHKQMQLD